LVWNPGTGSWQAVEGAELDEQIIFPIDSDGQERVWTLGWERAKEDIKDLKVVNGTNGTQINRKYRPNYDGALPGTWWDDTKYSASESGTRLLQNIFGQKNDQSDFSYPKSIHAVIDCLQASGMRQSQNGIALDFFGGSGTTAHAVMNLNREDGGKRKYLLIEMGAHYHTVILPRVKKVAFCSKWKDGKPVFEKGEGGLSHFVKYFDLEQYEDTLRRARYEDSSMLSTLDPYNSYVFLRDLKLLDAVSLDKPANQARVDLASLYPGIDLAETLSCLTGKAIRQITAQQVLFADGSAASLNEPDWALVKPLVWWA